MHKYFTNNTYNPHELDELKKLKNKLSMDLHPDLGGDTNEFITMMNEFKAIEDKLLSNIPFINDTIRVEVNLSTDFDFSSKENEFSYKSKYTTYSEEDLKSRKDYANIINTFVPDKYIRITENSIEFNKNVFIGILVSLLLLSTALPLITILSFIISVFSKNMKIIVINSIALMTMLLLFNQNYLDVVVSGHSGNQILGIFIMALISAPAIILTKPYKFELK